MLIRIPATYVCGSHLWPYRGISRVAEPTFLHCLTGGARRLDHIWRGFASSIRTWQYRSANSTRLRRPADREGNLRAALPALARSVPNARLPAGGGSLLLIAVLALVGAVAPWIAPYDPLAERRHQCIAYRQQADDPRRRLGKHQSRGVRGPQTNGCACHSVGVNEVGADQKFADPEFRFDGVALGHRVILQGRLSHGSSRSD
jgi:hypothetical protein